MVLEHRCLVAGCAALASFGYGNPAEPEKMRWACGEHRGLLEHGTAPKPAPPARSAGRLDDLFGPES